MKKIEEERRGGGERAKKWQLTPIVSRFSPDSKTGLNSPLFESRTIYGSSSSLPIRAANAPLFAPSCRFPGSRVVEARSWVSATYVRTYVRVRMCARVTTGQVSHDGRCSLFAGTFRCQFYCAPKHSVRGIETSFFTGASLSLLANFAR